jgi:hypothetical protein
MAINSLWVRDAPVDEIHHGFDFNVGYAEHRILGGTVYKRCMMGALAVSTLSMAGCGTAFPSTNFSP